MIENVIGNVEWLQNSVPLWAFLTALLTSPWKWAGYAHSAVDRYFGTGDSNE